MYDRISGILSNLPTTSQEAPAPSGLLPIGVEEPQYVLRKNKVKCPLCGATFATRAKYVNHYQGRH